MIGELQDFFQGSATLCRAALFLINLSLITEGDHGLLLGLQKGTGMRSASQLSE